MTSQTRATLKGYFTRGLRPTQSNYEDLIDSFSLISTSAEFVQKTGDTMTGVLTLAVNPTAASPDLQSATKRYVDSLLTSAAVAKSGDTMTGSLVLAGNPSAALDAAPKQYVDAIVSGYATLASPAFTGTPTAPTPTTGDNSTKIATTAFLRTNVITNATMQASTSGTSIDFTSIPSSKRIVVSFSAVSTNGTSVPIIQLGTSSTPKTSGYICSTSGVANAAATATAAYTTGFGLVTAGVAAATIYGSIIFTLMDASTNLWAVTGSVARNDATVVYSLGGSVALSGTLNMVRITTVGGSDTFDAGNINIQYS